jgi:hypothetical protein
MLNFVVSLAPELAPQAPESRCQQERRDHYPFISYYLFAILVGIVVYAYDHNLI